MVNLHISHKKTLFLIASFSGATFVICLLVVLSIQNDLIQLNSLLKSNYQYSVIVEDYEDVDGYLQYDAGISFAEREDSKTGINADVVMQTVGAQYTDSVYWSAGRMEEDEVAISQGIAKKYSLKVGDSLYSKNVIDGLLHKYLICQILPEVRCVRIQTRQSITEGLIVMGYDSNYYNNVSHHVLLFTDADINLLSERYSGNLTDIVYREDEVSKICHDMSPYLILLLVLLIVTTIGLVIALKMDISKNFKRLVTMGFDNNGLNRALFTLVIGTGMASIFFSFMISLIVFGIVGLRGLAVILLIFVVFVECITLLIAEKIIKWQLWRQ